MPNASNTDWDITAPSDTDVRSAGAREIRVLRDAVGLRMSKEHATLAEETGGDPAEPDGGGEHIAGSAFPFINSFTADGSPAFRPDGTIALTEKDAGRLWVDFDSDPSRTQYKMYVWVWDPLGGGGAGAGSWEPVLALNALGVVPDLYDTFPVLTSRDDAKDFPVSIPFPPKQVTIYYSNGDPDGAFGVFILPDNITTEMSFNTNVAFHKGSKHRVFILKVKPDPALPDTNYLLTLEYTGGDSTNNNTFNVAWTAHVQGTSA